MTPQQEDTSYAGYRGDSAQQHEYAETSYEQPQRERFAEKVYPMPVNNTNLVRLAIFVIAMVMLLICAILCLFFVAGTAGWVSFIVAAFVIFLITVVALEKMK